MSDELLHLKAQLADLHEENTRLKQFCARSSFDQAYSGYDASNMPIGTAVESNEIAILRLKVKELSVKLIKAQENLRQAEFLLIRREDRITHLNRELSSLKETNATLRVHISNILKSTSWRATKLLRVMRSAFRR
jgi:hypothetical protein